MKMSSHAATVYIDLIIAFLWISHYTSLINFTENIKHTIPVAVYMYVCTGLEIAACNLPFSKKCEYG